MGANIGDILAGHSPTTTPTMTETAVLEDTPHSPLSGTATAPTTIQLMDASITHCTMIPADMIAPNLVLTMSPTHASHITPQTRVGLSSVVPTMQHSNLSPEKPGQA